MASTLSSTASVPSSTIVPSDNSFDDVTASTTSELPVQITNAFSLTACVAVIIIYFIFRRKNRRLMERTSLVLAVSMASSDLLLHAINLFGYSDLPHNFICSFFGGFMYAFPTLCSIFFSVCLALNTQLVFVFGKRPGQSTLKYYIGIPIVIALCICVPALAAGVYGYDASWDVCWYSTDNKTPQEVLIRLLFTFAVWCLLSIGYLIFAAVTITSSVFSKSSHLNQMATSLSRSLNSLPTPVQTPNRRSFMPMESVLVTRNETLKSEFESEPPTPVSGVHSSSKRHTSVARHRKNNPTLSRRSAAMRALAFRLLGYIWIPMICILPGVINDLLSKAAPTFVESLPDQVNTFLDSLNGLVGLFNSVLFAMDPALLAIYHQIWEERKEKKEAAARAQDVELSDISRSDSNEVEVKVDTPSHKKAKHLKPIFTGRKLRNSRGPMSPQTPGIVIRVDVEVDNDIDRLENYLDGL